jgi:hypothetical protein
MGIVIINVWLGIPHCSYLAGHALSVRQPKPVIGMGWPCSPSIRPEPVKTVTKWQAFVIKTHPRLITSSAWALLVVMHAGIFVAGFL